MGKKRWRSMFQAVRAAREKAKGKEAWHGPLTWSIAWGGSGSESRNVKKATLRHLSIVSGQMQSMKFLCFFNRERKWSDLFFRRTTLPAMMVDRKSTIHLTGEVHVRHFQGKRIMNTSPHNFYQILVERNSIHLASSLIYLLDISKIYWWSKSDLQRAGAPLSLSGSLVYWHEGDHGLHF